MPVVATLLLRSGVITIDTDDDPSDPELAESTPLYLPSSLLSSLHNSPELLPLADKELRLRIGQADEALENIRKGRRMITGLIQFKKLNISGAGNKPNTRMRVLYDRLQTRIQQAASTYRNAYKALHTLDPGGSWKTRFRKLDAVDIRGPGRQSDDPTGLSKGRYEVSWIWFVGQDQSVETTDENQFDESMRAEWAKMKARQDRWNEEDQLLQEEMKRTVLYLEWKVQWWKKQATRRIVEDHVLAQGLSAYAERQAYLWGRLAASCVETWVPTLKMHGADVTWAAGYQVTSDTLSA